MAAIVGVIVAAGLGWWLSSGSGARTPTVIVELAVPGAAPASPPSVAATADLVAIEPAATRTRPRTGADGRPSWQVHARAFDPGDDRPRLAVIVTGLGLKASATEAAIVGLPGAVTLAFSPYAEAGDRWATLGRRHGHEVLVSLPLESADFPFEDAGPHALVTTAPPEENLRRLEFVLGRVPDPVGVIGLMGSRFAADQDRVRPVLEVLHGRGLMYVDGTDGTERTAARLAAEIGLPRAIADLTLDEDPSGDAIDRQLARLEAIARERAVAVAIARPYPVTLDRLAAWAETLAERDLVLAPVTAVVDIQLLP